MEPALKSKHVWVVTDSIVSPLGSGTEENFANILKSRSGVKSIQDQTLSAVPIHAGRIATLQAENGNTRFEQMCMRCIEALTADHSVDANRTLFILSTTKGNIDALRHDKLHPRLHLYATAKHIADKFGFSNIVVVSNACISGVMAIAVAKRYLQTDAYDHAIVVGADELTHFVVSGFQSLGALSNEQCRPFDKDRNGINLGEAAAAMLLTSRPERFLKQPTVAVLGAGFTNDANHISGPSRTGEELAMAIRNAVTESGVEKSDVDFISAHGTATLYNDEMEAKAFTLAGFSETPLNSLKGYYGHTLGAAGILETIISLQSLKSNILIPSMGYKEIGVSQNLNIITGTATGSFKTFLKTASGFGGCNAAIVLQKHS